MPCGVAVAQVACGVASTFLLVELGPEVEALPLYRPPGVAAAQEPDEPADEAADAKGKKAKGKRAAEPGSAGKAAKKTK